MPQATPAARKPRGAVMPPSTAVNVTSGWMPRRSRRNRLGRIELGLNVVERGDGRSASRLVVVERVPWMIAAGSSGPMVTPARRASITACWPQRRKSAQPVQSCAIFSGTQMCGTIVKPMRTKCDGSCVNAHSVENPLRGRRGRDLADELRTDVAAAERLVDDERAHLGDLAAERRQLGAADDGVVDRGHDEPRHVPLDVLDAPRQQVADSRGCP